MKIFRSDFYNELRAKKNTIWDTFIIGPKPILLFHTYERRSDNISMVLMNIFYFTLIKLITTNLPETTDMPLSI